MPESDAASAPPDRSSVYDFLYHDPRRIASFLAQFTQYGHLKSLSRLESTTEAASDKGVVTGRAGIPIVGSVGGSGETTASESVTEAITTTYDPCVGERVGFARPPRAAWTHPPGRHTGQHRPIRVGSRQARYRESRDASCGMG